MMRQSVQPRYLIFAKGYRFLSLAKNMSKKISKNVSSKYSQNILDHAKNFATDALKTSSKRAIRNPAEATSDLMGNKMLIELQSFKKCSPKLFRDSYK